MRLLYLVSHPIQYQAPLLRRIAAEPGITLRVVFGNLESAQVHHEPDFGVDIGWDVPLLAGYDSISLAATNLADEIAKSDAVWIHGWQYLWQRRAVGLARHRGIPVLMRGENWIGAMPETPGPVNWLRRRRRTHLFERCQAFLAIGSKNRDYYLGHGVPPEHIFSMPYAIDNQFFAAGALAATPRRSELRRELGLALDRKVLLFVGKLVPRKCPNLLLAAWRAAQWEGGSPALVFVGDGALRESLQRAVSDAVFVGFRNQSELPAYYDVADLLVVPSEREPWGLVVNEAMACGTAVVASDEVGAAYDVIRPDCGAMFRAGDADDLATKLVACLNQADTLGQAAYRHIGAWDFDADIRGLCAALTAVG